MDRGEIERATKEQSWSVLAGWRIIYLGKVDGGWRGRGWRVALGHIDDESKGKNDDYIA